MSSTEISYTLPAGPLVAHRLFGAEKPSEKLLAVLRDRRLHGPFFGGFRGYNIAMTQLASPAQASEFREIFADPETYGNECMRCFTPRFAISAGDGTKRIDALICIECYFVLFIRGESSESQAMEKLSYSGRQRLIQLHLELFPGAYPGPDY
jgi:hypothetical protein